MNQEKKICQNCKSDFTIEPEDFDFYERIKAPVPTWCPECRSENRLAFWPFGKFHKRTCSLTGKKIISIYPAETRFPVYEKTAWHSDEWETPSLEYDSNKDFFEQIYELQNKTPRPHQFGANNTNSEYCDDVWESKNCYLCRSLGYCEDVAHSYRIVHSRDSYDLFYCYDTEQSYDCAYCFKLFNVKYATDSRDSFDSAFLYDCRNVNNCFMCWNLRNKSYHILNQPYSEEEYAKKIKEYNLGSWESIKKLEKEFWSLIKTKAIHRANHNTKTVDSTKDYLVECKKCNYCYFLEVSEDCAYISRGLNDKDSQDGNGIWKGELIYNVCQLTEGYRLFHSNFCNNCRESEYLDLCLDCSHCFGCVGLKKKSHCILNKQYSESDYEKLTSEIKKKMTAEGTYGKFFPYKLSTCGYNLSLGGILFPKTKEEVTALGSFWEEEEEPDLKGVNTSPFIDNIEDVDKDILKKALVCEKTGRAFNITEKEFDFLKNHEIPLPHHYPDVRTMDRMQNVFNIAPTKGKCCFCDQEIIHFYRPELGYEKIACVDCYQKEII